MNYSRCISKDSLFVDTSVTVSKQNQATDSFLSSEQSRRVEMNTVSITLLHLQQITFKVTLSDTLCSISRSFSAPANTNCLQSTFDDVLSLKGFSLTVWWERKSEESNPSIAIFRKNIFVGGLCDWCREISPLKNSLFSS